MIEWIAMNDDDEVFVCLCKCVTDMCQCTSRVNDQCSWFQTDDIHRAVDRAAASAGSLQHCRCARCLANRTYISGPDPQLGVLSPIQRQYLTTITVV